MLKSVFTNRALLGIIAAALFLLLAMLTMQGMAGYVFPNFYGSAARPVYRFSAEQRADPARLRSLCLQAGQPVR